MRAMPAADHATTAWIDGGWLGPGARVVAREDPAQAAEVAATWCPATPAEAQRAMAAAAAAFPEWSTRPAAERVACLDRLLAALATRSEEFVTCITRENGKKLSEARAEMKAALADATYLLRQAEAGSAPEKLSAPGAPVTSAVVAEPVGVFLLVTPWNFPLATITRKLVPALAWGNTVVVKPAELTPGPARLLFELLADLPLRAGAANLVPGFGGEVGPALLEHPALRGISFTGSTPVGLDFARRVAGRDVRLQLELGGKNTLIVLADADLEAAVEAAVVGGFSCAGQWCTGTGRVVVESSVHDEFVTRLAARAAALRVGPGTDEATDVGPVVSAERGRVAESVVAAAAAAGARVVAGGRRAERRDGHYFLPTVLDGVAEEMAAFRNELFVPVLPVARAADVEDALRLANAGDRGLSASVYSRDLQRAAVFARRIEAGIVHVNLHTAYREPALPVAGWRDSGRGIPECGRFAQDFFTRPRAVYVHHP